MKNLLKYLSLVNIKHKHSRSHGVVLPKIQSEDIKSVEFLSIKYDMEDKLIKAPSVKEIINAFNFAIKFNDGTPLIGTDYENLMEIQLRIFLTNDRKLIIWHSSISDEILLVTYSTPKLNATKYIDSSNLGAILNIELESYQQLSAV